MFAGNRPHGEHAHRAPIARTVQNPADFDAAARQSLESLGHFVANLLDHHQRVFDGDRAFSDGPGSEFGIAHARGAPLINRLIDAGSSPVSLSSFSWR